MAEVNFPKIIQDDSERIIGIALGDEEFYHDLAEYPLGPEQYAADSLGFLGRLYDTCDDLYEAFEADLAALTDFKHEAAEELDSNPNLAHRVMHWIEAHDELEIDIDRNHKSVRKDIANLGLLIYRLGESRKYFARHMVNPELSKQAIQDLTEGRILMRDAINCYRKTLQVAQRSCETLDQVYDMVKDHLD